MKLRVVVGAVIEKDNCILLGQKAKNRGPYPNQWHIPGGGIENHETLETALRREILEETGLDINILDKLLPYEDFTTDSYGEPIHYIFHMFLASVKDGEVVPGSDLVILKWVPKAEIRALAARDKLPPPSLILFSMLKIV